jgi:O-antigen ligase
LESLGSFPFIFGYSQAQLAAICIILATGPISFYKRVLYSLAAIAFLYGMAISGTRGALYVLIGSVAVFLLVSRKTHIIILGSILSVASLGTLKYTNIGASSQIIRRLKTGLDFNDPSFQVRLQNQESLKSILANKPFGMGVGTIGNWGLKYNANLPISQIPPDSYYVKVWAEYGIVGLIILLLIFVFITLKSISIIWKLKDRQLANKIMALFASSTGILICGYGNEVNTQMPTALILFLSWVFVWLSPKWDKASSLHPDNKLTIEN